MAHQPWHGNMATPKAIQRNSEETMSVIKAWQRQWATMPFKANTKPRPTQPGLKAESGGMKEEEKAVAVGKKRKKKKKRRASARRKHHGDERRQRHGQAYDVTAEKLGVAEK